MTINDIQVQLTQSPKQKPQDESALGFGMVFSDHMLEMRYDEGRGWHSPKILPFGNIELSPSASVFHYGQEIFEGLKAYRSADNDIFLFRPEENFKRMNASAARLRMPEIDADFCVEALRKLVDIDRDWVPHSDGATLYIRPVMFATDPQLKVKESSSYRLYFLLSPSGAYYASGLAPVKIWVEDGFVRAVRGGIGQAKTGGNYASSLAAQHQAHAAGYAQVLWLDGVERRYIEEVGAMNIFFVIDGTVLTPELNGSILPGITRKSAIEVLKNAGYTVEERRISVDEIAAAYDAGKLDECFGAGTAAVISPVGELKWGDKHMALSGGQIGKVSQWLYDEMTGMQWNRKPAPQGWVIKV